MILCHFSYLLDDLDLELELELIRLTTLRDLDLLDDLDDKEDEGLLSFGFSGTGLDLISPFIHCSISRWGILLKTMEKGLGGWNTAGRCDFFLSSGLDCKER